MNRNNNCRTVIKSVVRHLRFDAGIANTRFWAAFLLLSAIIVRLFFFFKPHYLWWDSAVYIGMGKYIYSFGNYGLWEDVRPIIWPLMLGVIWKAKMNILLAGRISEFCFSIGILYLTYRITCMLSEKKSALFALLFLSVSTTFLFFTYKLYTEIPSTFFAVLAVYLFMRQRYFQSGVIAGLSFLTKFPQGIIFAGLACSLLCVRKIRKLAKFFVGFAVVLAPYLIFNRTYYGNALHTFLAASAIIKSAGLWIFSKPWYQYIFWIFRDNPLLLPLAVIGIYSLFINMLLRKERSEDVDRRSRLFGAVHIVGLLLVTVLFFVYLSWMHHKEPRFYIMLIPYLCIFAGVGATVLTNMFVKLGDKYLRRAFVLAVVAVTIASFAMNVQIEDNADWKRAEGFFTYLDRKHVEGSVFVSHPAVNLYVDAPVRLLYYPVFNSDLADEWLAKISSVHEGYLFMDTCEGGMLCPPDDEDCLKKRDLLLSMGKRVYYKKQGRCEYVISILQ